MKTLANCTPREFLTQTIKIKNAVSKWLTDTDIMAIRKRTPVIADGMSKAEKDEAYTKQGLSNLSAMYDEIAGRHPDETLELLALLCFTEPDKVDEHPMTEYLTAISDMLGSEAVTGFFTSLMKLARTGILKL